jgi:hypothetical protein
VRYVTGTQGSLAAATGTTPFALPDGRFGFVIGDVVGRGIPAAATMGRLRNALRAYAIDGAAPDEVVALVHRLTDAFEDVPFATLLYVLLDASSGEARYAAAGHPAAADRARARRRRVRVVCGPGRRWARRPSSAGPRSAWSWRPDRRSSCTRTGWWRRRDGRSARAWPSWRGRPLAGPAASRR